MSNINNNVTLPPIKHVFQGLFTSTQQRPTQQKFHTRSTSSGAGYPTSMIENEAARSLQQLSTCYRCPPPVSHHSCCSPPQIQHQSFGGGHRRAVSASIEIPTHPYQQSHHHMEMYQPHHAPHIHHHCTSSFQPQPHPRQQHQQHQQQHQHQHYRRARAHTTSGYPPTMLFEPHVYNTTNNNDNNNNNKQITTENNKHRYHCQHCRKSFSRPSSLRIHIYSHTGEKPFKCHYHGCGRSFSVHSNMRRHLRVHYYPQQQQQQQQQTQQHNTSMRLPIVPSKATTTIQRECCVTTTTTNVSSPLLHA